MHRGLGAAAKREAVRFPRWFNEGLAGWASGAAHLGDYERLDLAAALDSLPRLADLARVFPERGRDAALAYLTSEHFVRYLSVKFGSASVRGLVSRTLAERDLERAFRLAFGRPLEVTEL